MRRAISELMDSDPAFQRDTWARSASNKRAAAFVPRAVIIRDSKGLTSTSLTAAGRKAIFSEAGTQGRGFDLAEEARRTAMPLW